MACELLICERYLLTVHLLRATRMWRNTFIKYIYLQNVTYQDGGSRGFPYVSNCDENRTLEIDISKKIEVNYTHTAHFIKNILSETRPNYYANIYIYATGDTQFTQTVAKKRFFKQLKYNNNNNVGLQNFFCSNIDLFFCSELPVYICLFQFQV